MDACSSAWHCHILQKDSCQYIVFISSVNLVKPSLLAPDDSLVTAERPDFVFTNMSNYPCHCHILQMKDWHCFHYNMSNYPCHCHILQMKDWHCVVLVTSVDLNTGETHVSDLCW
jgi:hypothetical protein